MYLPIFTADPKPVSQVSPKPQLVSGRVLIMDDEAVIRLTLSRLLQHLGYTVDTAQNGEEALEKFDQTTSIGDNYKFVITDLTVVSGMDGKKLAQEITLRNPSIPIIVSSGYSDEPDLSTFKDTCVTTFLRKPYSFKELREALEGIDN